MISMKTFGLAGVGLALLAAPALAEVTSSSGSGSSAANACSTAKNAAGILAAQVGTLQSYGGCACSQEAGGYYTCTVDAYYRPYDRGGSYGNSGGYGNGGYAPGGRYGEGSYHRDSTILLPGVR